MTRKLVMTFADDEGVKCNVNVNSVKDDITADDVNSLMDLIVSSKIFTSKNGPLSSKVSAKTVDTEENPITLS